MRAPAPVDGDPATVRALAGTLAGQGDWLGSLGGSLRGLADPSLTTWDSAAGVAFGRRCAGVAGVVDRLSRRYAVAARALVALAESLARAQATVAAAQRAHEEAWPEFLAAGDAMALAESSDDPAVRSTAPRLRARMAEAGQRVQAAEGRASAAREEFRAADRRCASVLASLRDDGLSDSGWYDAVTTTRDVAGAVGSVADTVALLPVPPVRAGAESVAAVAGGAGLAADAALLMVWGDGSWSSLALGAAASAAGPVAGGLKTGARATNAAAQAAASTRVERRSLRIGVGRRLAVAVGAPSARAFGKAPTPVARTVRWTAPSRHPGTWPRWAAEQAELRTRAAVQNRWLDDWRAVTSTSGTSPRMLATAWGVEAGGAALDQVSSARDARAAAASDRAVEEAGRRLTLGNPPHGAEQDVARHR
ncbi:hypothetical protein RKE38_11805 [Phycicoccus sp. M110.8]|uniref:hypothetical protein n=1 Tax=Phycicoccus sp. M110.8 TaxID=3075433 RepID=UPI0028FD56D0|nr:hypothetical protein [Phycicoccus sp. M110.8]MDU0314374.1 hypothetical protein [Phycicoccus sp. M110.8]